MNPSNSGDEAIDFEKHRETHEEKTKEKKPRRKYKKRKKEPEPPPKPVTIEEIAPLTAAGIKALEFVFRGKFEVIEAHKHMLDSGVLGVSNKYNLSLEKWAPEITLGLALYFIVVHNVELRRKAEIEARLAKEKSDNSNSR